MLFPIKHENMKARRWPLVTIGLILVNFAIFLCTHQAMIAEEQESSLWGVKMQVLALAAQHPELTISDDAQDLVIDFQKHCPVDWAEMQSPSNKTTDSGDTQSELADDQAELQG